MKVSVIIPIYNAENYLEKSLNNYLQQTYKDIEFILVDDGSTDGSLGICEKVEKEYSNVVVVKKENGGVSSARNMGLTVSNGTYVGFFDADDYVDRSMIETLITLAEKNNLDIVGCGIAMELEDEEGNIVRQSEIKYDNHTVILPDREKIKDCMLSLWEKSVPYNIVNKLYRKQLLTFNSIEFPALNMGEDLDFNMQAMLKCESMGIVPDCFYHYIRNRSGAATNKYVENWFSIRKEENGRIKDFFIELFNQTTLPWEIEEYVSRRFVNRAIGCLENEYRNKTSNHRKNVAIKDIVENSELQKAIKSGKKYSLKIKLILIPIRLKSVFLTTIMAYLMNQVRDKFPRFFEYMKYRR